MAPKRRAEEINRKCPRCNGTRKETRLETVEEKNEEGETRLVQRNVTQDCSQCGGRGSI